MTMAYQVFLSHSTRTDRDSRMERILEGVYQCLTDAKCPTFWDRKCLAANVPLISELSSLIDSASVAVIFLTKFAENSEWVEFELEMIHQRRDAGKILVRAVALDDAVRCPPWLNTTELIRPANPTEVDTTALAICWKVRALLRLR